MEEQKLGRVVLSNTSREMYPDLHLTKLDVIEYYLRIVPGFFLISRRGHLCCSGFLTG